MGEWHPYGNPNASGEPGGKSAQRADVLRAELKAMRERKEFTPEYWNKMGDLEAIKPKREDKRCGAYLGSGPIGSGTANTCKLPKGHSERHRSWGSGLVTEEGLPMPGKFGKR